MQNRAAASYQTQQIMTASPAELVAMLYERALRALKDTVRCIEGGDIAGRCANNARAIEIIAHLLSTLDRDRGLEIAANLEQIYRLSLRQLGQVDLQNDPKPAQNVIRLLEPLAQSWRQLAVQNSAANARPAVPPVAPGARSAGLALSA